jgi:DNA-directed RNA polymerase subunit F
MKVKCKRNAPKWVDEEFKRERAARRKLERKWKKSRSDEDHERYVQKRNICAKLSLTKQEQYFSNMIESSENQQKTLFKVVNEVLDKKATRILPAHTDPVELANKFNEYYIEKIDKLRNSIPPTNSEDDDERILFQGVKLESFAPTTPDEVRKLIKEHGVKTSSEDPLPSVLVMSIMEEMIPFYVELVNKSFAGGHWMESSTQR